MLDRVREILRSKTDRAAFFSVVDRYFPRGSDEYKLIEQAYDVAKAAFKHKYRENGDRYFEHLRAVALILMVYLRVRDANVIVAALLHDIVEDIEDWDQNKIAMQFNRAVAIFVWWVSKPPLSKFNGNKEARNRAYHQNLMRAPREALLIKLADRLHNLLTLWETPVDKQKRKVTETQDFYLAIAEKEIVLIHEIEAAINEIVASWEQIPAELSSAAE